MGREDGGGGRSPSFGQSPQKHGGKKGGWLRAEKRKIQIPKDPGKEWVRRGGDHRGSVKGRRRDNN